MAQVTDDLITKVSAQGVERYVQSFDKIGRSLKTAEQQLALFERRTARIRQASATIGRAGVGMAVAGAGMIAFLGIAVKNASRVEEQMNLLQVIFRENTDAVMQWAKSFAEETGRSRFQLMGFASDFMRLLVPMGFARDEATKMSEELSERVIDIASIANLPDEQVAEKLMSGLAGMHRALQQGLGIMIRETDLDLKLQEMGIKKVAGEYTSLQKAQARYLLILERTSYAQNDAVNTSGSLENRAKRLGAAYLDMTIALGQGLYPAAQKVVGVAIDLLDRFNNLDDRTKKLVAILAGGGGLALAIGGVTLKLVDLGIRTYLAIISTKFYQQALQQEVIWAGAAAKANWGLAGARAAAGAAGVAAGAGGAAQLALPAAGAAARGAGAAGIGSLVGLGVAGAGAALVVGLIIAAIAKAEGQAKNARMADPKRGRREEDILSAAGQQIGAETDEWRRGQRAREAEEARQGARRALGLKDEYQQRFNVAELAELQLDLERKVTDEVERRARLRREELGVIDAQLNLAQAMFEGVKAGGARGGRLRMAQQWMAGQQMMAAQATWATLFGPNARHMSTEERLQTQAQVLRLQTGAMQTLSEGRKLKVEHSPWRAFTADRNLEAAYSVSGSAAPGF